MMGEMLPGAGTGPMFNSILNGRFGDVLTRMFWIRSAGAPAPTLSPEIQAGFDVNEQDDPSVFYLRGERLQAGQNSIAPNAGNYAKCSLNNATGSGILVIVERIQVATAVIGDIWYQMLQTNVAGTLALIGARDTRFRNLSGGATMVGTSDAVDPNPGTVGYVRRDQITAANTERYWERPGLVIPPGNCLRIGHGTIATGSLVVSLAWRERALTAEESSTG